jgi:hypothetical protein
MRGRYLLAVTVLTLLAACSLPAGREPPLPSPDDMCPSAVDWNGLVPGESSRRDVLRILGEPSHRGREQFIDGRFPFYAYLRPGMPATYLAEDRVYFGSDGHVSWIEVGVDYCNLPAYTIGRAAAELGQRLDRVYINNNLRLPDQYDGQSGPDQIYVWTGCGVALSAIHAGEGPARADGNLIIRYPVNPAADLQPLPSMEDVVVFRFLFRPTNWEGFQGSFQDKIPYHVMFAGLDCSPSGHSKTGLPHAP